MSLQLDISGCLTWVDEKGGFHREDGPAIIYPDGYTKYYINDTFLALNGPGIVYDNSFKNYYANAKKEFQNKY